MIGTQMEGINREGLKTRLRTDAKGMVQTGAVVDDTRLIQQKKNLAEINALYKDEAAQLRVIYDLQARQAAADKPSDRIAQEIAQREKLSASIRAEIEEKSKGVDTSKQELHIQNLERELQQRNTLKRVLLDEKQAQDEVNRSKEKAEQIQQQITKTLATMITLYATKKIKDFWQGAVEYAKLYYDQLNEIRIVSQKSEKEAEAMGRRYLQMGKDMKVSATEIATGAVEFYRQGLPDAQVDKRLENTIRYAKIGSLDFKQAAEIVTSATNAMEVEANKAVDVFTYLGDASASGADEVGVAMQRASSSALEAGVSFEWLGAMVATVSEKTRLHAEVIGTSFNAMFSRYQSIKTKGYNEEDDTKINDIAKALDTIDVKIIDGANNWKSFSDILQEVALQWDGLDGKTKAYITTALAGARQRDRLLALLNDMAKGAEGGSRAFELYEGALNSAGESETKYAIYLESVQAAQDGLKNSTEQLYATILSGNMMKGYYNVLSEIVQLLASGMEATDGWTLKLPA